MNKYSYLSNYLSELPDFVFSYIQSYYDGESINTQIGYSIDIRIFLNYLRLFKFKTLSSLEEFTPEHINRVTVEDLIQFKAYLREYQIQTKTADGRTVNRTLRNSSHGINRKLSSVRGLFTYLYKTDKISQNITDKVDFASISQKIKKPLTTQETIRILDVIYNGEKYFKGRDLTEYLNKKQRDIAIFTTYLGTGIRVSELVNLNITDICFETSSFIVTRKGGDEQEIFMPVQVENELFTYLQIRQKCPAKDENALFISRLGGRMTVSSIEKALKKYCMIANITNPDKTRPHALRRTFACRLLEDGVDIKMVAELMGHKNIEVTHKYYAQYSAKARKEVMKSLEVIPKETSD
ncbi:MAG: tyrosine-type recombinase/integrase [Clostridia bacterium]|nr:tyrosine-type recombinase/integrase [Clostridia bacterium]